MRSLAIGVYDLHCSGRTHRAISVRSVGLDASGEASLGMPAPPREFGGGLPDADSCPPELDAEPPLLIPLEIDKARHELAAARIDMDPRRVDVYQLGALLCHIVSGHTASVYRRNPMLLAKVSLPIVDAIDGALGYEPDKRFARVPDFVAALAPPKPASTAPGSSQAPPPPPPPAASVPSEPLVLDGLSEPTTPAQPTVIESPSEAVAQDARGAGRSKARIVFAVIAVLLLLGGALTWYVVGTGDDAEPPSIAEAEPPDVEPDADAPDTTAPPASLTPLKQVFAFDNVEATKRQWQIKGDVTYKADGAHAARGPDNFLRSAFTMTGDFTVEIDVSWDQAKYSNTGQVYIKACGEQFSINNKYFKFHYKGTLRRAGDKLTLTRAGGKPIERTIKPENLDKSAVFFLHWRSRNCHIIRVAVDAGHAFNKE
ncbi:MAG: hypothetical protein GC159_14995 [Phycisphaera sp.]|nr:hypothetical protein [Phycisphaera sp.]